MERLPPACHLAAEEERRRAAGPQWPQQLLGSPDWKKVERLSVLPVIDLVERRHRSKLVRKAGRQELAAAPAAAEGGGGSPQDGSDQRQPSQAGSSTGGGDASSDEGGIQCGSLVHEAQVGMLMWHSTGAARAQHSVAHSTAWSYYGGTAQTPRVALYRQA